MCIQWMTILSVIGQYTNLMDVIFIIVLIIVRNIKSDLKWLTRTRKIIFRDFKKKHLLESQGYRIISIQECKYLTKLKPNCKKIISKYLPSYYKKNCNSLSFNKIIKSIQTG